MAESFKWVWLGAGLAFATGDAAHAGDSPPNELAPLEVIAATPLPGAGIDAAKLPYDVRTLSASDLSGPPSVTEGLIARIGAVSVKDNLDDPFQPDILYRGFTASPVLGTPQGLAVYQNGVRINEAFGDAVNWDLVPDNAVARLDVVGANPVYGLNALGGAVVMTMKNGFDNPGGDAAGGAARSASGRRRRRGAGIPARSVSSSRRGALTRTGGACSPPTACGSSTAT